MKVRFEVFLLKPARDFVKDLNVKSRRKVLYSLKKSALQNDPRLFKKLTSNVWEFWIRTPSGHVRMLAFFDPHSGAVVVCTHGFMKKTAKVPKTEIQRAEALRKKYIEDNESL